MSRWFVLRKDLTEEQYSIHLIFERIRGLYGFSSNKKMLDHFELSESFCSQNIGRGAIPWKLVDTVSQDKGVSLDYLVRGIKVTPLVDFEQYELAVRKGLFRAKILNIIKTDKEVNTIAEMVLTSIGDIKPENEKEPESGSILNLVSKNSA